MPDEAAKEVFLEIDLHWTAATAGVTTVAGILAKTGHWVWSQIQRKEAEKDAAIEKAVNEVKLHHERAISAIHDRNKLINDQLVKERDAALGREEEAKDEIKDLRDEFTRKTLPLLRSTKSVLKEFTASGADSAALMAGQIQGNNDRLDQVANSLKEFERFIIKTVSEMES